VNPAFFPFGEGGAPGYPPRYGESGGSMRIERKNEGAEKRAKTLLFIYLFL
jgi:hypothetical protein